MMGRSGRPLQVGWRVLAWAALLLLLSAFAFAQPVSSVAATGGAKGVASVPTPRPLETPIGPIGEEIIGQSVAGRPLVAHRFGTGEHQRLIVAGIHGGYEWNTIALAEDLIRFLSENPDLVPPDVTLYIVPALNPDGEARSHGYEGRANENGVDLNRNFPSNWAADWDKAGCWDHLPISSGTGPWSEPESRAISRFILREHIEALISYHSAALGIFSGGRPSDEGSIRLAETMAAVTDYPYPPIDTGCNYEGNLADWASDNGVSAVDIELSTHYSKDYPTNLRVLLNFLNWRP